MDTVSYPNQPLDISGIALLIVLFVSLSMLSPLSAAPHIDQDEPYPSLSDYHDYEPNLEFDDTELQHTAVTTGKSSML